MSTFRFATGAAFLVIGLLMEAVSVFGIYRFGYSLNRMHSAAIGAQMLRLAALAQNDGCAKSK